MARIEHLGVSDEPTGTASSLDDLPPQDLNFDRMWEWIEDPSWTGSPPRGLIGEDGASLPVPSSSKIH